MHVSGTHFISLPHKLAFRAYSTGVGGGRSNDRPLPLRGYASGIEAVGGRSVNFRRLCSADKHCCDIELLAQSRRPTNLRPIVRLFTLELGPNASPNSTHRSSLRGASRTERINQ